jgi:Co/Zn/Cd efflux system component
MPADADFDNEDADNALPASAAADPAVRRTLRAVILLNLGCCGVEMAVAFAIASVALFADSIDFIEDAAVNALILLALGWSVAARARLGLALAALILLPGLATAWTLVAKAFDPTVPDALPLTLAGAGALAVNVLCALLLARHRAQGGALMTAAFLSARNDVAANAGIIAAGLATALTGSFWPDMVVGIAIAILNAGAAREVVEASRRESRAAAA